MMTAALGIRIMSVFHRWSLSVGRRNAAAERWQMLRAELAGDAIGRRIASHRAKPSRHRRPRWWDAPTQAYPQVGRAGWLTPAQSWRAAGGRSAYQSLTSKP
ncbi:MAG TPA: hypothetical protein VFX61_23375 [Micromonosporaceae bacterium]|nr:hypothetical protein [Micromonosporaceae bacterium]